MIYDHKLHLGLLLGIVVLMGSVMAALMGSVMAALMGYIMAAVTDLFIQIFTVIIPL